VPSGGGPNRGGGFNPSHTHTGVVVSAARAGLYIFTESSPNQEVFLPSGFAAMHRVKHGDWLDFDMEKQGKRLVVIDYRPRAPEWPVATTYGNSVRVVVWVFVQLHYDPRNHPIVRAIGIGSIDDEKGLVEVETMRGRYLAACIVRRKYDKDKEEHPWALEQLGQVWQGQGEPPKSALRQHCRGMKLG